MPKPEGACFGASKDTTLGTGRGAIVFTGGSGSFFFITILVGHLMNREIALPH